MTPTPENISAVDKSGPRFQDRPWDEAMLRFLARQRKRGKPIRWIAEKLGVSLLRAVAKAVNLGLVLGSAYRGRRRFADAPVELEPLGPIREIPDEGLCRWMPADPRDAWAMCARPTEHDSPWCPHHHAQAYIRRPPLTSNVVMAWLDNNEVTR